MAAGELRLFECQQTRLTSDDYYTPPEVFVALGVRFDMDVAAPPGGVPHVPADRYLTQAEDGLVAPWTGRVWMNPPYSGIGPWVNKFITHGNGIGLVPTAKSIWFEHMWREMDGIAAPPQCRVKFMGNKEIMYPVMFIAMGADNVAALARVGYVR